MTNLIDFLKRNKKGFIIGGIVGFIGVFLFLGDLIYAGGFPSPFGGERSLIIAYIFGFPLAIIYLHLSSFSISSSIPLFVINIIFYGLLGAYLQSKRILIK